MTGLPASACSVAARGLDEPMIATAPPTRRWLLLEVDSGWPTHILASPAVAGAVRSLNEIVAARAGRVLFIRRPGRHAPLAPESSRKYVVVDGPSRTETTGVWTPGGRGADGRLRAADLTAALRDFGARATYGSAAQPRLLVCTHGKRDQCCAVRGRPVAQLLSARWEQEVWECSHLGGDRFSPNVLSLPTGTYLGQLDPEAAEDVIAEHLAGRTGARHYRGISTRDAWAQAAIAEVLRTAGPGDPSIMSTREITEPGTGSGPAVRRLEVTGHPAKGTVRVRVERVVLPAYRRSCLADEPLVAVTYLTTRMG